MLELATFANLVMYAVVVSQHLFYAVALSKASRALSGPAYVELRNAINGVMKVRVPLLYGVALATCVAALALSLAHRKQIMCTTSALALFALIGDVALMLRENVPINRVIETWTPTRYPADWETYRTRWLTLFSLRQMVLGIGFLGLLVGVVAG